MNRFAPVLLTAAFAVLAIIVWSGCGITQPSEGEVLVKGFIRNAQGGGVFGRIDFGDGNAVGTNPFTSEYQIVLQPGTYTVTVTPSENSGYSPTTRQVVVAMPEVGNELLLDFEVSGSAAVAGRIVNSQTGAGVEGATLEFFRQDSGVGDESPAERAEVSVTTDIAGAWSIQRGPTGYFTLRVRKAGYVDFLRRDLQIISGTVDIDPFTLVEQPPVGTFRVVLTWGDVPGDLDSHLTGPSTSGGRYHVYYSDRSPASSGATLDLDDTSGNGPETTTFTSSVNGTYRFSVFNFTTQSSSGATGIASSPARVEVYGATGLVRSYTAPAPTAGNTWKVFEFTVNGTQISINDNSRASLGYVMAANSGDTTVFLTGGPGETPMPKGITL
ncbi:MAG TPA: carboxypeptidase regulatory-like domain-containing protein [Rubricoccaceae bacterium]|jgi:hypothetical protein